MPTRPTLALQVWTVGSPRIATVLAIGGTMMFALVLNEIPDGPLAQILSGGLALGIGAWGILSFMKFKEQAISRAEADRIEAINLINTARTELAARAEIIAERARADKTEMMAKIGETSMQIQRVNMSLCGYDGQGGLLEQVRDLKEEVKTDRVQRAEVGNAVLRIAERLHHD